jgi:hypothetical protein
MAATWWIVMMLILGGSTGALLMALVTLSGRLADREDDAYATATLQRRIRLE